MVRKVLFRRLLRRSWSLGVLGGLAPTVHWTWAGKLALRWRHALWLLVMLRLSLPVPAQPAVSGTNLVPSAQLDQAAAAAGVSNASPARPDLVGQVKGGEVFPKATVFISTAGPKVGTSTFCPSCYADCRKSAKTDEQGRFKIESLDPQLIFRILVVAKGYKPKFVGGVDPAKGPVPVDLEPVAAGEVRPDRSIRGQVVDPAGQPIYGAVVEAHGIRKKNDIGTMWGTLPGVDPLAVTDETGEFQLTAREPFEALDVRVEARAFANKSFSRLVSGTNLHRLTLTEGVSVTGRVVWNGKPLAGVSVGMVSSERGVEQYTGNFDVGTDSQGRFLFVNLPPQVDYFIYGMMATLKPYGAIPIQRLHTGADGTTVEAGDLVVGPSQRLAGQVVLADGQLVPAKTRLLVGRQSAWDSMQVELDKDGRFDTTGIPREALSLSARVSGYRVSSRNGSFDRLNPFQLVGRVERDVTNLVFLLERGENLSPEYGANLPESAWPQNRPLRGAEGTGEHSDQWRVTGRVRDVQTKETLAAFRVTPGNAGPVYQGPFWDARNAVEGSNGSFVVYLDRKFGQPLLKIEAEGYLPGKFNVLPESQTNLDFKLQAGAGPSGTVLLPGGKPAENASLALLCAGRQEVRLAADGRLRSYRDRSHVRPADPDGGFSFAPELDMQMVVAASKEGFRMVAVRELAANSNIVLEPWGRINGVLRRPSGAATNEDVDLAFKGGPENFLELHTVTDAEGRFEFERVPPGELVINGRNSFGDRSWTWERLQQVMLKPGQSLELTIEAAARTPPRSFDRPVATRSAGREVWAVGTNAVKPPLRKAGPGPEGSVLLPNGQPGADAEVALLVKGKYIALGRGSLRAYQARQEGLVVHSGPDGHFALPSEEGATGIVVVHDQGYAQVPLEALKNSPQVKLQAWGRIEGTLRAGRRPGTNELVSLQSVADGNGSYLLATEDFQARTDDEGRFIITFVPPGERKIARMISRGSGSWQTGPPTVVNVLPGTTTRITIGGSGRTVSGKVRNSEAATEVKWSQSQASLHSPLPRSFHGFKTVEEQEAWARSDEGKAFTESMKNGRSYPVTLSADGSFRAEEVLPGSYELDIILLASAERARSLADFTGRFHVPVTVPEPKDKEDDSPVEVGILDGKLEPMPGASPAKEVGGPAH